LLLLILVVIVYHSYIDSLLYNSSWQIYAVLELNEGSYSCH